jgi:hypothetical protein
MLDAPTARGAILRRSVDKVVVRIHSGSVFSVVVFLRPGLVSRAGSALKGGFHVASPTYPEEIGTSLQGFDAHQVSDWLGNMGYRVETADVAPVHQATGH